MIRQEVLAARLMWPRVATRAVAIIFAVGAIMSVARQSAISVATSPAIVRTRWIAVPELCETTEGVWKRCPWAKR